MDKILVIEDDSIVRSNTIEILEEEGFRVIEAANGKEGIEKARRDKPDLILSDILMPEGDGFTVLRELQKDAVTASIPFIFLSGRSASSDIRKGMLNGADDYLPKPFKARELIETVQARIAKSKAVEFKYEQLFDEMSRNLPHELRTPLISILGLSEYIKDYSKEISKEEMVEMTDRIHSSGNRLFNTINKFLLCSELAGILGNPDETNNIRSSSAVAAKPFISSAAKTIAAKSGRSNDLKLSIAESCINISATYLELLLTELLESTLKYSTPDKPFEVYSYNNEGKYLVEITDHGYGMGNFSRTDLSNPSVIGIDSSKKDQNISGISMLLCQKILILFNGELAIESRINKYTRISFSLPAININ